jgi:hypothetical protein
VYVGRGVGGLRASRYANPHTTGPKGCKLCGRRVHSHAEAVSRYRTYLRGEPELVAAARAELAGRDLACWCKPEQDCHADLLIVVAAGEDP